MSYSTDLVAFDNYKRDATAEANAVVGPFLDDSRQRVLLPDGSSDIYGMEEPPITGVTLTHTSNRLIWDLAYDLAVRARWVVLPQDGPVCLVDPALRNDFTAEASEHLDTVGWVVIHSGADLIRVIETS